MRASRRLSTRNPFLLAALGLLFATTLEGQSIVAGSVDGVVRTATGDPLRGASVVLRSGSHGFERVEVTDGEGRFALSFVSPGSYEVVVEALGYVPVLVRPLDMPVGEAVSLALTLEGATGVVARVDTVAGSTQAAGRWTAGGVRIGPGLVDRAPSLTDDLTDVAALVPAMDGSLGGRGLPGSMSSIFVDGVRFDPAVHPAVRGEGGLSPMLGRNGTAWLQAFLSPGDAEWGGGGTVVSITSRTSTRSDASTEVSGAWSGGALWNSSTLDFDAPALSSAWAAASAQFELVADTSRMFVTAEGMRVQTPRAPRLGPGAVSALDGLDPGLAGALTSPSVEEVTRASGLARVDWWFSPVQRFSLRAALGHEERRTEGPGLPLLDYGATPAATSTDFSVAADLTNQQTEQLTLEFRGALSGSVRDFEADGRPQAFVVEPGAILGSPAGAGGSVSRLDFNFGATAHYRVGPGRSLKGGAQLRATRFSYTHGFLTGGRYVAATLSDLAAAPASFASSTGPETTFPTSEAGVFGQYTWSPGPDVRVSFGGRVDYETLPAEAVPNVDLRAATGLDNADYPTTFLSPGVGASATWALAGADGPSTLVVAGALQTGDIDPAFVAELFAQDGDTRATRVMDSGTGWPGRPSTSDGTTLPALTLFGPAMRPPRHLQASAGLVTRVGPTTSLYTGGSVRRTDFLPRRRNFNVAVVRAGSSSDGRALWGDLRKDGALLTVDGRSHRRFSSFDDIWAVDPDGWSTYSGLTVGIEHRSPTLEFEASYTRSRTEDNWFGAAAGLLEAAQPPHVPDTVASWSEGPSDFDVPDRAVATATLFPAGRTTVTAVYRYESGRPFTPGYRRGVDANADGSGFNDPAFVPADVGSLSGTWDCLSDLAGAFATRNACRGPGRHGLDVRVALGLGTFLGRTLDVVVDGLGIVEADDGIRDTALLLVDPDAPLGTDAEGRTVIPTRLNPDFGQVLLPYGPGRILRIGVRLGGR